MLHLEPWHPHPFMVGGRGPSERCAHTSLGKYVRVWDNLLVFPGDMGRLWDPGGQALQHGPAECWSSTTAIRGLQPDWPQNPTAKRGGFIVFVKEIPEKSQGPDKGEHPSERKEADTEWTQALQGWRSFVCLSVNISWCPQGLDAGRKLSGACP